MFSLFELLSSVPTPLEQRVPGKTISKARSRMTPDELAAWKEKYRASRRAYDIEYKKRMRAMKSIGGGAK